MRISSAGRGRPQWVERFSSSVPRNGRISLEVGGSGGVFRFERGAINRVRSNPAVSGSQSVENQAIYLSGASNETNLAHQQFIDLDPRFGSKTFCSSLGRERTCGGYFFVVARRQMWTSRQGLGLRDAPRCAAVTEREGGRRRHVLYCVCVFGSVV